MRLTVRRVIEIAALYPDANERRKEFPELDRETGLALRSTRSPPKGMDAVHVGDMIGNQLIDQYARPFPMKNSTRCSTARSSGTEKRYQVLHRDYQDPDALRKLAASIKDHTLHHLGDYLAKAEQALVSRGVNVHFAATGDDAKQTILSILRATASPGSPSRSRWPPRKSTSIHS
jgi:hypothetical protein